MHTKVERFCMEALPLLRDYLWQCRALNIKPRIDGDSLMCEHNVAARLLRNQRDEARKTRYSTVLTAACNKLQEDNYSEKTFFVRGILNYEDLLDEAKQQHNCVAGIALPDMLKQSSAVGREYTCFVKLRILISRL